MPGSEFKEGSRTPEPVFSASKICCLSVLRKFYLKLLSFLSFPFFFFSGLFSISWAAPEAYGGSQVRGLIRAVATGLRPEPQQRRDPSHVYNLHHSSRQLGLLNALSEAKALTRKLMVSSGIAFCCTMAGTP